MYLFTIIFNIKGILFLLDIFYLKKNNISFITLTFKMLVKT